MSKRTQLKYGTMQLNIMHWFEYKFQHINTFSNIQLYHQYMNDLAKHLYNQLNLSKDESIH